MKNKNKQSDNTILLRILITLIIVVVISILALASLFYINPNTKILAVNTTSNLDRVHDNITNSTCIVKADGKTYCSRYSGAKP